MRSYQMTCYDCSGTDKHSPRGRNYCYHVGLIIKDPGRRFGLCDPDKTKPGERRENDQAVAMVSLQR